MAHTEGPWYWERIDEDNVILRGKPNEWNDTIVLALRADLARFPDATDNPNARLVAAAPEFEETLSLLLRTYREGALHGFTESWQEEMDEVANQARQLFRRLNPEA